MKGVRAGEEAKPPKSTVSRVHSGILCLHRQGLALAPLFSEHSFPYAPFPHAPTPRRSRPRREPSF
jgi:hypothetical protein